MKRIAALLSLALMLSGCTPSYTRTATTRPPWGKADAAVVVEEFGDFQCPACGQAYVTTKQLKERFGDSVQWKFYHFPLTNIHPYAFNAAMASECANDQGKFWEYHDILFENQESLSRSDLKQYAEKVGLDVEKFETCLKSRIMSDVVRADMDLGATRSITATPTFFVNGQEVVNWNTLGGQIEALLTPSVPRATSTDAR